MIKILTIVALIATASLCTAQEVLSATDPVGAASYFSDRAQCLQAIKEAAGDAPRLFRAGRYLMAVAYSSQGGGGIKKADAFDLCRQAYGCFESAFKLERGNALYAAWSGSARLLSCAYGNTFAAIQNGAKGVASFKSAIKIDPKNPDLRLLRARAFVYLPRAFYPDCDQTILEDTGIVIDSTSAATRAYLDEALCYRCIALKQTNRLDEATATLATIDPKSRFAMQARDWRKR